MAVELFGPKVAPYACAARVISFLMTGHRSVYPSQVLSIKKSRSIQVEIGQEIEDVEAKFHPRRRSITGRISQILRAIREKEDQTGIADFLSGASRKAPRKGQASRIVCCAA